MAVAPALPAIGQRDVSKTDRLAESIARERRAGRLVGPLTLVAVVVTLAAVLISARGARDVAGSGTLATFAAHDGAQLTAAALRTTGLLLVLPFMVLWHRLLTTRDPGVSPKALVVGVVATVLIAGNTVAGWLVLDDLAETVVEGRIADERRVLDSSTALDVVRLLDVAARLLFATWLGYVSLRASRVGLLTPSLGIWGLVASVLGTVSPIGDALYIAWLGSVALLVAGYWPGGRPPSWSSGRSEAWVATTEAGADNVRSPMVDR